MIPTHPTTLPNKRTMDISYKVLQIHKTQWAATFTWINYRYNQINQNVHRGIYLPDDDVIACLTFVHKVIQHHYPRGPGDGPHRQALDLLLDLNLLIIPTSLRLTTYNNYLWISHTGTCTVRCKIQVTLSQHKTLFTYLNQYISNELM